MWGSALESTNAYAIINRQVCKGPQYCCFCGTKLRRLLFGNKHEVISPLFQASQKFRLRSENCSPFPVLFSFTSLWQLPSSAYAFLVIPQKIYIPPSFSSPVITFQELSKYREGDAPRSTTERLLRHRRFPSRHSGGSHHTAWGPRSSLALQQGAHHSKLRLCMPEWRIAGTKPPISGGRWKANHSYVSLPQSSSAQRKSSW